MMELDKLLLTSLQKLKDSTDLRRRVLLYPIFDKLLKYRTFDEPEDGWMEVDDNVTFWLFRRNKKS